MNPMLAWSLAPNALLKSTLYYKGAFGSEESYAYTTDDKGRIVKEVRTSSYGTGTDTRNYTTEFFYEKY